MMMNFVESNLHKWSIFPKIRCHLLYSLISVKLCLIHLGSIFLTFPALVPIHKLANYIMIYSNLILFVVARMSTDMHNIIQLVFHIKSFLY